MTGNIEIVEMTELRQVEVVVDTARYQISNVNKAGERISFSKVNYAFEE